jgi:iron complex outermembrane receptor protein
MKNLIILFLLSNTLSFAQQVEISGKIIDADSKQPLPKANIYLESNREIGTASDERGEFKIEFRLIKPDNIVISYVGYQAKRYPVTPALTGEILVELESQIIPSQSVLVTGSIGKEGITPIAFDKIKRSRIEETYIVQDIPEFVSSLPSTMFYSENGNGIGYNYLSIRGFDQRRISVSINGVPQNDPEDHNVYWLDFPDLLASTEIIQVQRGAGSGVFGYPAIGGSINIITSAFSNKPGVNLSASLGSFNTRKYSASFSSGLFDDKYSVYAKFSQILSGGYRNHSWVKFNSYHLSFVRFDDNLTTQLNLYGGPIEDGLAYMGIPKKDIKDKTLRKGNYSYWYTDSKGITHYYPRRPTEIENFSQPHYELMNEIQFNNRLTLNSNLFLVIGKGFFDYDGSWADSTYLRLTSEYGFTPAGNPQNVLIRAQVENFQYGWIPRIIWSHENGNLIIGGEFRKHTSEHWGSINYGENLPAGLTKDYRYYFYNGGKDIFNIFIHESYNLSDKINLLGEFQLAYHKYRIYNERFARNDFSISNLFLNPRLGINYKLSSKQNIYFSFAGVTREPRLKNYYDAGESSGGAVPQFEVKANGNYDFNKPLVEPETMNDFELGTAIHSADYSLSINLFYMLFNNEIVKKGKIDRFGQPVTGNVDKTTHQGIELSGILRLLNNLEIFANATYSKNIIDRGRYYIDANSSIELNGNRISGFPDFMANFGVTYRTEGLFIKLSGRYLGEFYSDNFDNKLNDYLTLFPKLVGYRDNKNESYFTADAMLSYQFKLFEALTPTKVFCQVNNLFNNLYSAYVIGGEFFPAAERNFIAGIEIGL